VAGLAGRVQRRCSTSSPANTQADNGRLSGHLGESLDAYDRHGGVTWAGVQRHVEERVRMAPVDSGPYGIDSGQDRYVRTALEKPADLTS
jgi:hypothetical protein